MALNRKIIERLGNALEARLTAELQKLTTAARAEQTVMREIANIRASVEAEREEPRHEPISDQQVLDRYVIRASGAVASLNEQLALLRVETELSRNAAARSFATRRALMSIASRLRSEERRKHHRKLAERLLADEIEANIRRPVAPRPR